jgi:hypothetical protein
LTHHWFQAAIQVAMVVMKGFIGLIVIFIAVMIGLNLLSFFQDEVWFSRNERPRSGLGSVENGILLRTIRPHFSNLEPMAPRQSIVCWHELNSRE